MKKYLLTGLFCSVCGKEIKKEINSCSTGYGVNEHGEKTCFKCIGKADKKELVKTGKLTGYFSTGKDGRKYFTNWPGSLSIHVYYTRQSWHNFAGKNGRTDFWFLFEGQNYWGVQIGNNNQIARVKRVKK